jgi:hypothetical protein
LSSIESLSRHYVAHLAAFGATSHPAIVGLMEAALESRNEGVCASVLAHVEASAPKETKGLAAIAAELSADARPPSLWLAVDVEAVPRPVSGSLSQALQLGASLTASWQFRRENATHPNGRPLAARILFPSAPVADYVEAACHVLRTSNIGLGLVKARDEHRQAILSAAIERAKATGKGAKAA